MGQLGSVCERNCCFEAETDNLNANSHRAYENRREGLRTATGFLLEFLREDFSKGSLGGLEANIITIYAS
jgi:hypothetical protein